MQSLVGEIFVTKFFHNLSTGTKTFKQRVDVKKNKATKSSLMETFLEIRLISRKISVKALIRKESVKWTPVKCYFLFLRF